MCFADIPIGSCSRSSQLICIKLSFSQLCCIASHAYILSPMVTIAGSQLLSTENDNEHDTLWLRAASGVNEFKS